MASRVVRTPAPLVHRVYRSGDTGIISTDVSRPRRVSGRIALHLAGLTRAVPLVHHAGRGGAGPAGQQHARFHDPCHEIYLIESGTGYYEVNGVKHAVRSNDLLLLKPGDTHRFLPGSRFTNYSIHFSFPPLPSRRSRTAAPLPLDRAFFAFVADRYPGTTLVHLDDPAPVREAAARAAHLMRAPGLGCHLLAGMCVIEILVHVSRHLFGGPSDTPSRTERWTDGRDRLLVAHIDHYIDQHFAEDLDPSALFRNLNLHPNYCRGIYRRLRGQSVTGRILERRMAEARRLLLETDDKVSVVARQVNIGDYSFFMRAFKRAHGVTPGQLRSSRRS